MAEPLLTLRGWAMAEAVSKTNQFINIIKSSQF